MFDCGWTEGKERGGKTKIRKMKAMNVTCIYLFHVFLIYCSPVMMRECVNVVCVVSSFMCEPTIDGLFFFLTLHFIHYNTLNF